jgi:hypothetical protein
MFKADKLNVVLIYASQDEIKVTELYHRLRDESWVSPWYSKEDLPPGITWSMGVSQAIRGADVIIICLSKKAVSKEGNFQRDVKLALETSEEKLPDVPFIIPVRLDECKVLSSLNKWQWLDYFTGTAYEKLRQSLELRAKIKMPKIVFLGGSNKVQVLKNRSPEQTKLIAIVSLVWFFLFSLAFLIFFWRPPVVVTPSPTPLIVLTSTPSTSLTATYTSTGTPAPPAVDTPTIIRVPTFFITAVKSEFLRAGPNASCFSQLDNFLIGEPLIILARSQDARWYQVNIGNVTGTPTSGWVFNAWIGTLTPDLIPVAESTPKCPTLAPLEQTRRVDTSILPVPTCVPPCR